MAFRATLVQIQKSKKYHLIFQTENKKASKTREEERSSVILTGCLRLLFFVFFHPHPPRSCVLFLLEKCNSLLCGVKLQPAWSCISVVRESVDEV